VIPTLLLAAGSSRRFGDQKLLQELDGKPLIRWTAEALDAVVPDETVVVVPPFAGKIRAALSGLRVRFVENRRAEDGMGTSIAAGIGSLDDRAEAVLVTLADVPFGPALVLPAVVQRYRKGVAEIVAPSFRGVPGHPVLFARSVFPELAALRGDSGARAVIERDPARRDILELDVEPPADVDTPDDLARLRR
jgi:molybdenum cofactor cytidylyltransferase